MSSKGKVMPLSATTLQMQEAVDLCIENGKLDVEIKDIVGLTRLSKKTVSSIMGVKTREGCFVYTPPGIYHIVVEKKLTNRLPASFVAEKVWAVLDSNRDRFLNSPDVQAGAETLAGQRDLCLNSQVHGLLGRWRKSGYLERIGKKGNYAYRILPGITSRPPIEN